MHHIINCPVVDLRREPVETTLSNEFDPMQETQLLYGEEVTTFQEKGDWIYIHATEQQKCLPDGSWSGYPGWIKKEFLTPLKKLPEYNLIVKSNWAHIDSHNPFEVSIGTRLQGVQELPEQWVISLVNGEQGKIHKKDVWLLSRKIDQTAQSLLDCGRKMIGFPYFWGGRSAFRSDWPNCKTSIDCSGFVNLLYRIHGISVPRDAHDQFLKTKRCEFADLVPGDLVFTASEQKPQRISHVMIYSGDGNLLEATAASKNVREVPSTVRFICPISEVASGGSYNGFIVHFGKV